MSGGYSGLIGGILKKTNTLVININAKSDAQELMITKQNIVRSRNGKERNSSIKKPEPDIDSLSVSGSGLFLFSLSQKITSDCIENRAVCSLFSGKTGEIVGCMSFRIR